MWHCVEDELFHIGSQELQSVPEASQLVPVVDTNTLSWQGSDSSLKAEEKLPLLKFFKCCRMNSDTTSSGGSGHCSPLCWSPNVDTVDPLPLDVAKLVLLPVRSCPFPRSVNGILSGFVNVPTSTVSVLLSLALLLRRLKIQFNALKTN